MNIFKCIHNEISTQKHNNIGTYLILWSRLQASGTW